jgi:hypothetical protein
MHRASPAESKGISQVDDNVDPGRTNGSITTAFATSKDSDIEFDGISGPGSMAGDLLDKLGVR